LSNLSREITSALAEELYRAEKTRTAVPPITQRYADIDPGDAYRVQLALIEKKKAAGAKVVGKKIGLTSKAMQKMLNVDQPDYGHLLDHMVVEDGTAFPANELIQPKIEPEVAFILEKDLEGPGITPLQVLACTRFVVPALEIIDSRIQDWKIKLCDTIADNASSARVVLGGPPRSVDQVDLRLIGMVMEKNGAVIQTGAGAAVLGHPANAVAWLANALSAFGVGLKAGEVVLPGAISAAADVSPGDVIRAFFDGLGAVSVRFI
jgi:2-keto-4-pentenoate hydratase